MQTETHKLLSILGIKALYYMQLKLFWASTSAIDSCRNVHYSSSKILKIDWIELPKSLSMLYVGVIQYADKPVKWISPR